MEKTTRIADLPENITVQMPSYNPNINQSNTMNAGFDSQNNYIPINVHPNPYGISAQNPIMPIPQQPNVQQMNPMEQISVQKPKQQFSDQQMLELQNMQQMRLPSRDIPIDTTTYLQDEQVQPNYIPKPKLTADYIQEYQETANKKIQSYEKEKKRERLIETWLDELYQPIIVGFLYFIFQLPIINRIVFQRFSFLQIYKEDGNFNIWGLCLKGLIFAMYYYFVQKSMKLISEL